jgi:hypothetical protein
MSHPGEAHLGLVIPTPWPVWDVMTRVSGAAVIPRHAGHPGSSQIGITSSMSIVSESVTAIRL